MSISEKLIEFRWHRMSISVVPLVFQHLGDAIQSAGARQPSVFFLPTAPGHVFIAQLWRQRISIFNMRMVLSVAVYPLLHRIETLQRLGTSCLLISAFSALLAKADLIIRLLVTGIVVITAVTVVTVVVVIIINCLLTSARCFCSGRKRSNCL